jgi:phospholipase C
MCPFLSKFAAVLSLATCSFAQSTPLPYYEHVVVVIMSSHSPDTIVGSASAPYINGTLLPSGAKFSAASTLYAPEQPNYIVLLAGDNLGVTNSSCNAPNTTTSTLPRELVNAALSFADFSEDLPAAGDMSCLSGDYTRAHNPVTDFSDLPASMNQPYTAFTAALANNTLPTVSYVIPNICHDMKGESIGGSNCQPFFSDLVALGDAWLSSNIPPLLSSAAGKSTLLIITWDVGDANFGSYSAQIPVIFVGPHVKANYTSSTAINHLAILRLIEDLYAVPELRYAAAAAEITDVFDNDAIFRDGFE